MKIIYTSYIPWSVRYINLFGILIARKNPYYTLSKKELLREEIRSMQKIELLFVLYYIIYFFEFLWNFLFYQDARTAKRMISFELEIFNHRNDYDYPKYRKHFNEFK